MDKLVALNDAELNIHFKARKVTILDYMDKVLTVDESIIDLYDQLEKADEDAKLAEITAQVDYNESVRDKLTIIEGKLTSSTPVKSHPPVAVKIPKLECRVFDGTSKDKLEFKNFLTQFNNCIDACGGLSNANKLTYLRSYLSGYAFKMISHLSVNNDNYDVALSLLKEEFLDIPYIIDESFKVLLSSSPSFDTAFDGLRTYINECRAIVHDLKQYNIDLFVDGTAGCKLLSHIIFAKLPVSVRRELIHKVNNNYPSLSQIFDNYREIIKTLVRVAQPRVSSTKSDNGSGFKGTSQGYYRQFSKPQTSSKASPPQVSSPMTLENFNTSVSKVESNPTNGTSDKKSIKHCKLCGGSHNMIKCSSFTSLNARQARCITLNLCKRCTSSKHKSASCPGKDDKLPFDCYHCKAHSHIAALCPNLSDERVASNFCVNVHQSSSYGERHLLPVLTLTFHGINKRSRRVRCLLDSGSQRSYLSKDIVEYLKGDMGFFSTQFEINTFLGSARREFGECLLEVTIPGLNRDYVHILVASDFNIKLYVSQLDTALYNVMREGYQLAEPSLADDGELVPILGLVGVDLIQRLPEFAVTTCMQGAAFATRSGLIPFGNISNFLYPGQARPMSVEQLQSNAEETSVNSSGSSSEADMLQSSVNFVMSPTKSYFSPLESLFPDSSVEQGLEAMFNLDSLGHNEQIECDFDRQMIDKFEQGISLQDGKYHVELPWKEDVIDKVPSNHKVALSVLDKVVKDLDKKGMLSTYLEVFKQQQADGIIKEFNVHPDDYHKFIWIPHRPVVKTEANTTTKVRPVFNCSLKTNKLPSLNEAAYAGINLLKDIVQLSLKFRSNKFTMVSDIKQAFLQIKLAKEDDKNRFCFFMRDGDRVISYRYETIIFGFNSSPFILNYVLKHHVEQYAGDAFSKILRDNMYVDNLLVTSNNLDFLEDVYFETQRRLGEGGFTLRSWNSNSTRLKSIMINQGNHASHGNSYEKVLGMKYMLEFDSLQVSEFQLDSCANTKRGVLAQISKVFDPLGLYLPVTNKGKFFMRDLWAAKLEWDDVIPEEKLKKWSPHCTDLNSLATIVFPRSCVNEASSNSLVIFTDASKLGYGFAIYNVADGCSRLLYAKSRVAPIKAKTLPTLELLGVHHALKSLPFVLDSFANVKFMDVTLSVDSQVVLQWLLADSISTKSIFTRNRVKDIEQYKKSLLQAYGITICFKYVKSEENPCDLLTRGLSFKEFIKNLSFWQHGPRWLPDYQDSWPNYALGCLSAGSKALVAPRSSVHAVFDVNVERRDEPLLELERFPSFSKALRVTTLVFKAIFRMKQIRKSREDLSSIAKLHLLLHMQSECFPNELRYLSLPDRDKPKEVPNLINNLDLFLDDKGLIRSRGRIAKSLRVTYDIQNPILMGKGHKLTEFLVEFYHKKCKHLGLQTTLNKIRTNGFWIPKMRQVVKGVLSSCITCRKFNSLSFRYPRMTNLPKHRVNLVKPFQHTGVDFTGHLWVKNENGKDEKMYILLFTCLNVRVVHIELVPDMSTVQFVLAFTRFINTYGIPSHLYSDNAKSFVAGGEILQEALLSDEYKSNFDVYDIRHVKIPLYSAWVGATWERLIRTVKSCLYKSVGRSRLSYFELLTVMTDIQNAVNSRPLTYRSSDNDLETITPNCFLKTDSDCNVLLRFDEDPLWERDPPSRDTVVAALASRDECLAHFKELWYNSYLLSLRETCRDLHQVNWNDKISVDDIVLVKLLNKTRPFWVLGRVLELVKGHDDKVRSVKLKRGDGVVVHHSINHLYPLELSLSHNPHFPEADLTPNVNEASPQVELSDNSDFDCNQEPPVADNLYNSCPSVSVNNPRPRRAAAVAGRNRVQTWDRKLNRS